jgi:hypothetical protein
LLSEADLDPIFDAARFDAFRLEIRPTYTSDVESPRLRSYLAGDPYDPAAEPHEWYQYIQDWTDRGVNFRKVHVVRSPLSEYLRWECEWSYTATERRGQRTHILDLAEVDAPPALPDYDFWMFDESVVLKFVYNDSGGFVGAERLSISVTGRHVGYRDAALKAATPFPAYWQAHPNYWRDNWINSRKRPGGA